MKVMSEAEIAKGRRLVVRHKVNTALPYVYFALTGALIAAVVGILHTNKMRQYDADFANAPVRSGTASVASKVVIMGKTSSYTTFQFLVQGHRLSSNDAGSLRTAFTKVGDTVAITYRVGKSGAYDLMDWQAPPRKMSLPR